MKWITRQDGTLGPPRHWYLIYVRECPVCGRSTVERIRQYGPRPKNDADRYDYNGMAYDYCDVL